MLLPITPWSMATASNWLGKTALLRWSRARTVELCNLLGDDFLVDFFWLESVVLLEGIYIYMQMICIYTYIQIWIKIDRVYNPSLYIYLHIKTDTENKHTFEQNLMFKRMSSNKQMSAMPRFRSNSLVAYNAALSGQGSDHGWWLCLSMLEAGWIFNGLLWLGYAWNPGIDSVRCEFERKICHLTSVLCVCFIFPSGPSNHHWQTTINKTMKKQNSTHSGIWWNQMECDEIWW